MRRRLNPRERGHAMDLHECLAELTARRYTQTEIADATGIAQPTISRVRAGSGTSYEYGRRIVAFFEREKANGFVRKTAEAA